MSLSEKRFREGARRVEVGSGGGAGVESDWILVLEIERAVQLTEDLRARVPAFSKKVGSVVLSVERELGQSVEGNVDAAFGKVNGVRVLLGELPAVAVEGALLHVGKDEVPSRNHAG